jgi:hypothetical protein
MSYPTRALIDYYYTAIAPTRFKCRACGVIRTKQASAGYTNLLSHLEAKHANFRADFEEARRTGNTTLTGLGFVNDKAKNLHDWVRWVVDCNQPFSAVENLTTRGMSRLKPICSATLKSTMQAVSGAVKTAIANEMPTCFGLVMDGWTDGFNHFCGIFATYSVEGHRRLPLLAMAPLLDDDRLDATAHCDFIRATLEVFSKDLSGLAFISADNCATNGAIARLLGVPLVGCYSHKFNLAMQQFLADHVELLSSINILMGQLGRLRAGGQLRRLTELRPVRRNATRWSSVYKMVQRFVELLPYLDDVPSVDEYMLTRAQTARAKTLAEVLTGLDSVTRTLQSQDLDMADVRALFAGLYRMYPDLHHLSPESELIRNPDFENGVVKILSNIESELSQAEALAVQCFCKPRVDDAVEDQTRTPNLATELLRVNRRRIDNVPSLYADLAFVLPTSNVVERLFSVAKYILTDTRKHMHPINFEMVIFLRTNSSYWSVDTVADSIQ